jgi:hypothetical protein
LPRHSPLLPILVFFFKSWWDWFELRAFAVGKQTLYHLNHTTRQFALVILEMEFSWTVCLGWPWTTTLPISASQVARITGLSHWCPTHSLLIPLYWSCSCQSSFWLPSCHIQWWKFYPHLNLNPVAFDPVDYFPLLGLVDKIIHTLPKKKKKAVWVLFPEPVSMLISHGRKDFANVGKIRIWYPCGAWGNHRVLVRVVGK